MNLVSVDEFGHNAATADFDKAIVIQTLFGRMRRRPCVTKFSEIIRLTATCTPSLVLDVNKLWMTVHKLMKRNENL
jgi:hypothetical protein